MAEDIKQAYELVADADTVFACLTDPRRLDQWWTTASESDPTEGGSFAYVWEFEDAGRNGKQQGVYTEVIPGKRLSYPWDGGGFPTTVQFTIDGSSDGSTLSLLHSGWDSAPDEIQAQIAEAWGFFLGNLKSYLEEGKDMRSEALGQKVG